MKISNFLKLIDLMSKKAGIAPSMSWKEATKKFTNATLIEDNARATNSPNYR